MKSVYVFAAVLALGFSLPATPARADGFVSPSIGVDFGGNAGDTLRDASHNSSKINFGVAAGFMSAGILGLEEDFSYAPNFFGSGGALDTTRVTTLMTNVIIGVPVGGQHGAGVRPYASVGVGWLNRNVQTASGLDGYNQNDFAYDIGAGVMGYFADHVGLRADVRYFRNTQDTTANTLGLAQGQFKFLRGSIGVLFRF